MSSPIDFLAYATSDAANGNDDPIPDGESFDHLKGMRERTAAVLRDPRLPQDHRMKMEMLHARLDRFIKGVESRMQRFNQDRLIARLRQE